MSGLIGKKIGMTSLFNEEGKNMPCTVIQVGPCIVTQIKTEEKDGYNAVQIGYGEKKEKRTIKSEKGHFEKAKTVPLSNLAEFANFSNEIKLGDKLAVDLFEEGEFVDVTGVSKGKGFQGVVKRHGFKGVGDRTHGQHNRERAPGSIGASSYPSRVFKGMRMAGQMGNKNATIQNLKVLKVDIENNVLVVKGSVPGHNNSVLIINK